MRADLIEIVGAEHVEVGAEVTDMSRTRGTAAALVRPGTAAEVAAVAAWCYERDVAIVPVGGRTGVTGGCVPIAEAVCVDLTRLDAIRSFDPLVWRMEAEAGVRTATVARRARENGLQFGPDPGASEQSTIGGNLACNAGGPHGFKHGPCGAWVTGVEAVIAPGELVRFGGPSRKDVAGYDLRGLLIGSEGTLGIITAAWLKLLPAPSERIPVAGVFASVAEGVEAIERVMASGFVPEAVEFFDGATLSVAGGGFPGLIGDRAELLVVAEADGRQVADALTEALGPRAQRPPPDDLWRWRDGVPLLVAGTLGAMTSEDIAVPLDRFAEALTAVEVLGQRHGLRTCAWGHAGDGNIHAAFLHSADAPPAKAAVQELFDIAIGLGGTVSGEHGLGLLKHGQLARQWAPGALGAARAVKAALDPKGLFNPGKKLD